MIFNALQVCCIIGQEVLPNMYLSLIFTIVQMMHVSGHKTQKTFMDYIKLSLDEIADENLVLSQKYCIFATESPLNSNAIT